MPSVGRLEANQAETDAPLKRMKRSGGQSLVRSGRAYWVKENELLRMLPELGNAKSIMQSSPLIQTSRFPIGKMPSAEVAKCVFDDPEKATASKRRAFAVLGTAFGSEMRV